MGAWTDSVIEKLDDSLEVSPSSPLKLPPFFHDEASSDISKPHLQKLLPKACKQPDSEQANASELQAANAKIAELQRCACFLFAHAYQCLCR